MNYWLQRVPASIATELLQRYQTEHIIVDHIVDWLLIQELDRRKKEKFTPNYNLDTLHNHVGDANYVQD